ncbi:uncharacterized protein LY89DRAFT_470711 [Mollisia scopiformis]|uniref:Uncharacterized protein n=1 Tax=Mollisia scopiformis TaxID=149040 RepID=A0A194XIP4_MOLSC|nr:uncharacterized protein LY89DRAFT_470711 [Mollisia scopiformis]KUJ20105.1 hypothetical protein LY89DRAFT_470711 [Mollisia scopiformis]
MSLWLCWRQSRPSNTWIYVTFSFPGLQLMLAQRDLCLASKSYYLLIEASMRNTIDLLLYDAWFFQSCKVPG